MKCRFVGFEEKEFLETGVSVFEWSSGCDDGFNIKVRDGQCYIFDLLLQPRKTTLKK